MQCPQILLKEGESGGSRGCNYLVKKTTARKDSKNKQKTTARKDRKRDSKIEIHFIKK